MRLTEGKIREIVRSVLSEGDYIEAGVEYDSRDVNIYDKWQDAFYDICSERGIEEDVCESFNEYINRYRDDFVITLILDKEWDEGSGVGKSYAPSVDISRVEGVDEINGIISGYDGSEDIKALASEALSEVVRNLSGVDYLNEDVEHNELSIFQVLEDNGWSFIHADDFSQGTRYVVVPERGAKDFGVLLSGLEGMLGKDKVSSGTATVRHAPEMKYRTVIILK